MQYGKDIAGVCLERECSIESDNRKLVYYSVEVNGICICQHADPHIMADELDLIGERILSIARFLRRKKK